MEICFRCFEEKIKLMNSGSQAYSQDEEVD
jgi:hypothetical protein